MQYPPCPLRRAFFGACALTLALFTASCGGGGGNSGDCNGSLAVCNPSSSSSSPSSSASSSADSAEAFTGLDPSSLPRASALAGSCSLEDQKRFTRSLINDIYLFYDEVPAVDARSYSTIPSYFSALLVRSPDANGVPKDRFSTLLTNAQADTLTTGVGTGYGVEFGTDGAGRTRVAYVVAGSPAASAGMARGGELVSVISSGGGSVTFNYRDTPASPIRVVTLTAATVTEDPVPLATALGTPGGRRVGYIVFNAHTRGAQDRLIAAVNNLVAGGPVDDLVVDMRYNGGGYLYTALSLSSMITSAGNDARVFERLQFNDKRAAETAANTVRFSGTVQIGESSYPAGAALPRLGLPRVYVLSTDATCSASESVINSLRGIDVDVVLVGGTTCGKPYGFSRVDNCGLSYFAIEFKGTNDKGFGDYTTGFKTSCTVPDDFDRALGDPAEAQLAAALFHVDTGACPAGTATASALRSLRSAVPQAAGPSTEVFGSRPRGKLTGGR